PGSPGIRATPNGLRIPSAVNAAQYSHRLSFESWNWKCAVWQIPQGAGALEHSAEHRGEERLERVHLSYRANHGRAPRLCALLGNSTAVSRGAGHLNRRA